MGRRKETTILDNIFDLLKIAPVWFGPVLAVGIFVVFQFVFPAVIHPMPGGIDSGPIFRPMFKLLSWVCGGAVLLAWVAAEIWKLTNRRLLDTQTDVDSLREITWREFERLVSEAYRRRGYLAEVVGTDCGDSGVDIRLSGQGERVLVQCKQWKAYKVSVTTVRELLGVVVSERADRGIVVTSGYFTKEARKFAEQNRRIELVDGPQLAALIRSVRNGPQESSLPPAQALATPASPPCPVCGAAMVLRTARKGTNAGSQFWGCRGYPTCRGIRQATPITEI